MADERSWLLQRLLAKRLPDSNPESSGLKRVLGAFDLTMFGIGAIIGTGIFVMTGTAAAGTVDRPGAGPALVLSFALTAVACGFAALCYAEFASMIPTSGSAYTYAYASFGELVAWIIGWDLILEYAVGNVAIAIGWSGYLVSFLGYFGLEFPAWLQLDPMTVARVQGSLLSGNAEAVAELDSHQVELVKQITTSAPQFFGRPFSINLPAGLIVLFVSTLLYFGVKESARTNTIIVFLKFIMIGLFLIVGARYFNPAKHWVPFAPNGLEGILTGASIAFFAYIGFDSISTAAEEAKEPQRTLPIAIIGSLIICTVLYVLVSGLLTGMVPLHALNNQEPVAAALKSVGAPLTASVISLGAIFSMASVLLVMQLGQSRIFFAMSRDGLIPAFMSKVHPRYATPHISTILTGIFVCIPAMLIDIQIAADICSIGTLFAFILVALGVWLLRYSAPDIPRSFRTPLIELCAPMCVIACAILMYYLDEKTWTRFVIWLALGLVIYFGYGLHRSQLAKPKN
jgi:basic amino acid/polyamine antiporter, APA family